MVAARCIYIPSIRSRLASRFFPRRLSPGSRFLVLSSRSSRIRSNSTLAGSSLGSCGTSLPRRRA
jgi:hypothetical protein